MKFYKIKKLIEGYKLGIPGKKLIAFKDLYLNQGDVCVSFDGNHMIIENGQKALTYRAGFKDKFGRTKDYTLCYFEWIPVNKTRKQIENEEKEHLRAVSIAEAEQQHLI